MPVSAFLRIISLLLISSLRARGCTDLKHLNQALVLLHYYKNSPPISKSWIRACIREKIHGEEHGDVAGSYHNLACDYRNIGKHEQAIECNLAVDNRNIGKHEQAKACYNKAVKH